MQQPLKNQFVIWIYIALALASIIAFEPVRGFEFVNYDDDDYVTENRRVREGMVHDSVVWAFTKSHASNWHPLTWMSHMLDCGLFGLKAGLHHMTSLIFHIANTLLLFWVFKKMTGAIWPSAFVAAAFALHPLHVESVAWISERKDVPSMLFWLLTINAYVEYVKLPDRRNYLMILLFFALGLMAKPMVVTLPFVLLLLDYWPLQRFKNTVELNGFVREKIPMFALASASCAVTFLAQQSSGVMEFGKGIALNWRVANAFVAYISYIIKMIYPVQLAVLYPHPENTLPMWQVIISLIILIGISAVVIFTARKRKYLAVGWFWYLGTLVPVIGLVQVGPQAVADRYTYIPLIGIFIIIAYGAVELFAKWRYRKLLLSITAAVLLVAMMICTRMQLRHWQNSSTLFKRALEVTQRNPIIHNNMGVLLISQNNLDEAADHLQQALEAEPDYVNAHYNLGNVFLLQEKLDDAITHYRQAIKIHPNDADAHNNLGSALQLQGKLDDAISHYLQALKIRPNDDRVKNNLNAAMAEKNK